MIETLVCVDFGPRDGHAPDLDSLLAYMGEAVVAVHDGAQPHWRTSEPQRVVRIAFDADKLRNTDAQGAAYRQAWVSHVEPGNTTVPVDGTEAPTTLGPVGYDYALLIAERRTDGHLESARRASSSRAVAEQHAREWMDEHPPQLWRLQASWCVEAKHVRAGGPILPGAHEWIDLGALSHSVAGQEQLDALVAGREASRPGDEGVTL
jgi:hypothetical protein